MLAAHMCFVNREALGATEQQGIVLNCVRPQEVIVSPENLTIGKLEENVEQHGNCMEGSN